MINEPSKDLDKRARALERRWRRLLRDCVKLGIDMGSEEPPEIYIEDQDGLHVMDGSPRAPDAHDRLLFRFTWPRIDGCGGTDAGRW